MPDHAGPDTPVTQTLVAQNELETLGLRFVQAFNERDMDTGLAMSHPEIVANPSRVHGRVEGYEGHAGLLEWFERMSAHESGIQLTVTSMHQVERRSGDRRDRSGVGVRPARLADVTEPRSDERRRVDAQKLAIFGEMCIDGESLGPWAAVLIIQNGLILRQRSYLSTRALLEEIGVVSESTG